MYAKRAVHIAQLSVAVISGYYLGHNFKLDNVLPENEVIVNGKRLRNKPGLPIFGTVSAAAPYTEGVRDRVS